MQENLKQVNRSKVFTIIATCLLLVLFTASVFLAVIAPVFTSNGVASAIDVTLPDNGIVGENLLPDSYFLDSSFYPSNAVSLNTWYYTQFNGGTFTFSNGLLSNSSGVGGCELVMALDNLIEGADYTFTFYCTNFTGSCSVVVRNSTAINTPSSVVVSKSINSNYSSVSFTASTGVYKFLIVFTGSSSISSVYSKLEKGASFTGYVPDYQNQIDDLQNEVDSQKDTVANYNFSSRFVTPINTPSRQVYFNLNRYPVVPSKKYFKSPSSANWYYMNYFYEYDIEGGQFGGNYATNLGWEVYYNAGSATSFYKAVLKCNGTAIFQYDCTGSSFDTIVYSNPTWLVASNMQFNGISIYCFDFSGSSHYYTLKDNSTILDDQFSNSCWAYSFALQDINNWKDLSYDVYYNNGYNNGFSAGKDSGFSSGKDSGYKEGFSAGKDAGYKIGFDEGVTSGQDYSFTALFGAVFDVPIQAFKGLFNFEIFGVNMTSFVSSLLALCVIVVIVKICLGGK